MCVVLSWSLRSMSWPVEVVTFVLLGMNALMTEPVDSRAEVGVGLSVGLICVDVDAAKDEI